MHQLVQEILPAVADPLMLALKRRHPFTSVITALFPTSNPSLKDAQLSLLQAIPARVVHLLAIARGKQAGNADIHADILFRLWQRRRLNFTGKTGVPLVGPARNANRF